MSVHNDYDLLQDALAELDELKASPLADAIGPLLRIIDAIDGARRAGWAKYYAEREAHEDTERRLAAQTMAVCERNQYVESLKAALAWNDLTDDELHDFLERRLKRDIAEYDLQHTLFKQFEDRIRRDHRCYKSEHWDVYDFEDWVRMFKIWWSDTETQLEQTELMVERLRGNYER